MSTPGSATNKKDFFVSYTQADKPWAEWIAWHLEAAGYSVVVQAWDFRPGGNFVVDMQKAASECERTIAVLSDAYLNSQFTQSEWTAAFAQDPTGEKGLLLPVRIAPCEPRGLLPQIVYIDLVALTKTDAKKRLLDGVIRGRAKPQEEPPFPGDGEADDQGPEIPEPDEATKKLMRLREAIANCLQTCSGAMVALVAQFPDQVFPGDAAPRARRLAEELTKLPLDTLVLNYNRAHAALYEGSDPGAIKINEQAIIKIANLTVPVQVDHAHLAGPRQHFAQGQLALLALPARTATVAEILLAAADDRPTGFREPAEANAVPYGTRAQPLAPETGLANATVARISALRTDLANKFLTVQTRTAFANDSAAMDREINEELEYRLEARAEGYPERYYMICEPPADGNDFVDWQKTVQELITTYPMLAFVQLAAGREGQALPESIVSRAIRDMLWRACIKRQTQ